MKYIRPIRKSKAAQRAHHLRMIAEERQRGHRTYRKAVFEHFVYEHVRLASRFIDLLIERQVYRRFDGKFRKEILS